MIFIFSFISLVGVITEGGGGEGRKGKKRVRLAKRPGRGNAILFDLSSFSIFDIWTAALCTHEA